MSDYEHGDNAKILVLFLVDIKVKVKFPLCLSTMQ